MANPEHLKLLKQGVKGWNAWRDTNVLKTRGDLSGADLSRMDLSGAYLSDSNFSGADLQAARLGRALMNRANLSGANLSGAELNAVQLVNAILFNANLTGANLSGADLTHADLSKVNLREAKLNGAKLHEANLEGAKLIDADLTGASLAGANLQGTDLSGANLSGAKLLKANLTGVDLRTAKLTDADLGGLDLDKLIITEEARRSEEVRRERERREASSSGRGSAASKDILGSVELGSSLGASSGGIDTLRTPPPDAVKFTAFHPIGLRPQEWYTLLVYAHVESASSVVLADSRARLGPEAKHHQMRRGGAMQAIARGAEIVVVPEMPGCRFNPPRAPLLWLEDWHRVEFRMQASPELPGFAPGAVKSGRIAFYVGPILIAEVMFESFFSSGADVSPVDQLDFSVTVSPYQAIFVSYSHQDTRIVERLEKAYKVLGFQYLRDVAVLRSGEEWRPALLKMIEKSNIFQLCWSAASKRSPHVEQEWRHAFRFKGRSFIRPVYWERPMPAPPLELSEIHFDYLEDYDSGKS